MGQKLNHQGCSENHQGDTENHKSGCMWGAIAHHFQNKRWNQNVKNCVPQSKFKHHRHTTSDQGKAKLPPKSPDIHEKTAINGQDDAKPPRPTMRSRLKALFTERMPKRRNRRPAKQPQDKFVDVHRVDAEKTKTNDYGDAFGEQFLMRTSSFDDLIAKYNQILEISNYGKIRSGFSSGTTSPIPLQRTLSLPDLSSYFRIQIDDRCDTPDSNDKELMTPAEASEDGSAACKEDQDSKLEEEYSVESETTIVDDDEILQRIQVDEKNMSEFVYVKQVLEQSKLSVRRSLSNSAEEEAVDSENERSGIGDNLLMFDLVNEVLLGINERRLCLCQGRMQTIRQGGSLEEVWTEIRRLFRCRAKVDRTDGDVVRWDMENWDRWMDLPSDKESAVVEVEGLLYEELLDEFIHECIN